MAETDAPPPEASPQSRLGRRQRQAQARPRRGRADDDRSFVEGRQEAFRGRTHCWRCVTHTPQRSHQVNIEQQYLPPRFAFVGQAGQVRGTREPYFPVASFNGKIQIMPKAVRRVQKKDESWLDETLSKSVLMTDSQYGETLDYGSIQLKSAWDDFPTRKKLYKPSQKIYGRPPTKRKRKSTTP